MIALSALFVVASVAQFPSGGPDLTRDVVLTEKSAVFLTDPEPICASTVTSLVWSPDSTYLLATRQALAAHPIQDLARGTAPGVVGEIQVLIYAKGSKRVTTPLRLPLGSRILESRWIPGSSRALVTADVPPPQQEGIFVAPVTTTFSISAAGDSRKVAESSELELANVVVAPNRPLMLLTNDVMAKSQSGMRRVRSDWTFMDAEGKVLNRYVLPVNGEFVEWRKDGSLVVMTQKVEERRLIRTYYSLAPTRSTPMLLSNYQAPDDKPEPVGAKELVVSSTVLPSSKKDVPGSPTVALACESTKSFGIVSSDATMGSLAPDGSAVAYVHHGLALVRPLVRMPKEAFLEMKQAAERAEAISQAKQAALALMMHASDNDDNLLGNAGDWRSQLGPYVRDPSVLNGFTYTYAGGAVGSIQDTATTQIGYVQGPGGRAVAFADGHVKWIKD